MQAPDNTRPEGNGARIIPRVRRANFGALRKGTPADRVYLVRNEDHTYGLVLRNAQLPVHESPTCFRSVVISIDDIMRVLACVLYVLEDGVHRTDEQIADCVRGLNKDQVVEAIQNWSLALASLDAP